MLQFLLLLLLVALITYLALIFTSTGLAVFGFATLLLGILSFATLTMAKNKVTVDFSIPIQMAQRDQSFGVRLEVKNQFFLPLGKVSVHLQYGESHARARERTWLTLQDVRRGENSMTKDLSIGRAGYYEFAVREIRLYDVLGLFYLNLKKRGMGHAMILPDIREIPVQIGEAVRRFYGEAVSYDEFQAGNDPGEVFEVREFRAGDKLQRVHWKLSARVDDLLVKDYSFPKSPAVILVMPEGAMGENGNLEFMASLSFSLMDAKCPHYVVWHSQSRSDVVRTRVEDEESFYVALTAFLQDGAWKSDGNRLERYREKYRGEPFLHAVVADGEGRIAVDGDDAVKNSEWKELTLR